MRSQTKDTTSLGCAIAAAAAEGIDLFDFSPQNRRYSVKVHHDTYLPTTTVEDRRARNRKWKMAVERSYGWATSIKSTKMTSNLLASRFFSFIHFSFAKQTLLPFTLFHIINHFKYPLIYSFSSSDERYSMLSSVPITAFAISSFVLLAMSEMYSSLP